VKLSINSRYLGGDSNCLDRERHLVKNMALEEWAERENGRGKGARCGGYMVIRL
jgi:hypothetical protein